MIQYSNLIQDYIHLCICVCGRGHCVLGHLSEQKSPTAQLAVAYLAGGEPQEGLLMRPDVDLRLGTACRQRDRQTQVVPFFKNGSSMCDE